MLTNAATRDKVTEDKRYKSSQSIISPSILPYLTSCNHINITTTHFITLVQKSWKIYFFAWLKLIMSLFISLWSQSLVIMTQSFCHLWVPGSYNTWPGVSWNIGPRSEPYNIDRQTATFLQCFMNKPLIWYYIPVPCLRFHLIKMITN